MTTLETRITDIEIRLTYQEDILQALNKVIIDQQKIIEQLTTELAILRQQMLALSSSNIALPSEETPPPHY